MDPATCELRTEGAEETLALGHAIGERLAAGHVVLLYGDLGAGKTTLTRGIAEGLGIRDYVTSPTFTLANELRGPRLTLYHLDAYRLEDSSEVADLGFDEYLESGGVVVVEWAERLGRLTPVEHLAIRIDAVAQDEMVRRLVLEARGGAHSALLDGLRLGSKDLAPEHRPDPVTCRPDDPTRRPSPC